ncbi:hypothetical protein TIFTF001_051486, partial [Ficus carica]
EDLKAPKGCSSPPRPRVPLRANTSRRALKSLLEVRQRSVARLLQLKQVSRNVEWHLRTSNARRPGKW